MRPATEDTANRRPVWEALSDLFLDTNLQRDDFQRIGRALANSPYDLGEIRTILWDEVYPVCHWDLLSIAGQWGAFDGDWLQGAILKHSQSWFRLPRSLRLGRWMIWLSWHRVKRVLQELRKGTDAHGG